MDEYKGKLKKLGKEIAHRNSCINSGDEDRDVECREELDPHLGKARLIRVDTGEVVSTRPMRADEYQSRLRLMGDE